MESKDNLAQSLAVILVIALSLFLLKLGTKNEVGENLLITKYLR